MPRKPIPERNPVSDIFTGSLFKIDDNYFLSTSTQAMNGHISSGELIIRYGFCYLGKPHLAIVPGLVALDYGDMLTGEPAFEFILKKANLHPRAEVIGYRNDGQDDMIVIKNLDLALPLQVLAYADPEQTVPLAEIRALIAPHKQVAKLTQHLQDHLPHFATIADWQTYQENHD